MGLFDDVSPEERAEAQQRVAISTPEQLRQWMIRSGRPFVVFLSEDLVAALKNWPGDALAFQSIVTAYREVRGATLSSRVQKIQDDTTGHITEVVLPKTDALELEEIDRCIRWLVGEATAIDPNWKLENTPL